MDCMENDETPTSAVSEKKQIISSGFDLSLGFPYTFDQEGRLLHRETREPFTFRFRRGGRWEESEREQQALGQCVTQHVLRVLEEQYQLCRVSLPSPQTGSIFVSQGALESTGMLLVLIQDQGSARCGQWSWRAIARHGLDIGSQVPYVRRALQEHWGVVLLNPNEGGASPEEHVRCVWESLLAGCPARQVAVATHGYGGLALVDLLSQRPEEVQRRICAVAFIDSTHNLWHQPLSAAAREWLRAHSRKWVLSSKPLNRPVGSLKADCYQLSAGTQSHEAAPASCIDSVFRYIIKALKTKPPPTPFDIITRSRSQGLGWPHGGGCKLGDSNGNKI